MPVSGLLSSGIGVWRLLEAHGFEPAARRTSSATLAVLSAYAILAALNGPMGGVSTPRSQSRAIETILLSPPPPEPPTPSAHTLLTEASHLQSIAAPGSMIDTSTPTPLSNPEWSVSPLRIAAPRSISRTNNIQGSASGNGAGTGGSGVYDPYAGATPMRQSTPGVNQPPLVPGALAAVIRQARERTHLRNPARCELLIALTGAVIEAACRLAGGQAAADLAGFLIGQRLYSPSTRTHRATIELEP